ncbi:hypothetical protein HGM15179_020438 [Zosterops borbonicus]|uniref:Uncharacterized protein n=1 Tax=Zosterops borbonicus TaxID=364589 RepID=A0A8K1FV03_9PASS|nr:hypothetical protein HGM15179_020438 [Zosterops borbonicus]
MGGSERSLSAVRQVLTPVPVEHTGQDSEAHDASSNAQASKTNAKVNKTNAKIEYVTCWLKYASEEENARVYKLKEEKRAGEVKEEEEAKEVNKNWDPLDHLPPPPPAVIPLPLPNPVIPLPPPPQLPPYPSPAVHLPPPSHAPFIHQQILTLPPPQQTSSLTTQNLMPEGEVNQPVPTVDEGPYCNTRSKAAEVENLFPLREVPMGGVPGEIGFVNAPLTAYEVRNFKKELGNLGEDLVVIANQIDQFLGPDIYT